MTAGCDSAGRSRVCVLLLTVAHQTVSRQARLAQVKKHWAFFDTRDAKDVVSLWDPSSNKQPHSFPALCLHRLFLTSTRECWKFPWRGLECQQREARTHRGTVIEIMHATSKVEYEGTLKKVFVILCTDSRRANEAWWRRNRGGDTSNGPWRMWGWCKFWWTISR